MKPPTTLPVAHALSQPVASQPDHNRVLIADDDALVRGSLAAVLEYEGYEVDEACDGREAVNCAEARRPNLILLDLNMPHWDGWMAYHSLGRISPHVPVIVITARPHQYQKAQELGVDAFMEKPLNIAILMRAIRRLTDEDQVRWMQSTPRREQVTQLLNCTDS